MPPVPASWPSHRSACRAGAGLFLVIAIFQLALAAGAPLGGYAWGGFSEMLSPALRAASTGAAVYLLLAAWTLLVRGGDLGRKLPQAPFLAFNVVLAIQLALNIVANLMARSAVERFGMTGVSALAFLLVVRALFRPAGLR